MPLQSVVERAAGFTREFSLSMEVGKGACSVSHDKLSVDECSIVESHVVDL